jgi:hypothetical protein
MLQAVFGAAYLIYLASPHLKKAINYLLREGGSAINMDVRPIYHEESCAICLENVHLKILGPCGHTFCGITKAYSS